MDLLLELKERVEKLDLALRELRKRGESYATAERDYKCALSKKILQLRADGYPATLIADLSRGDKEIALCRFNRDIAQTMYKAALEAINVYKLEIRVLENQIEREWKS